MQTYELVRDQIDAKELERIAEELHLADKVVFYTPYKNSSNLIITAESCNGRTRNRILLPASGYA